MRIDLDGRYIALAFHNFRHNCRVIACSAANMDCPFSWLKFQLVEKKRQEARITIIKMAACVNRDQDIVIEASRIRILGCPIPFTAGASYLPRPRPKEMLARNFGECLHERFRLEIGHRA